MARQPGRDDGVALLGQVVGDGHPMTGVAGEPVDQNESLARRPPAFDRLVHPGADLTVSEPRWRLGRMHRMSPWSALVIALAGAWAGIINTIVGSGTLVTFPTLLFFGFNPLVANVSNNIGLVAGGITGSWGYRHELTGQAPALRRLMPISFLGSVIGAGLLLVLPPDAFQTIVPVLILIALVMVIFGPAIQRRLSSRAEGRVTAGHGVAMAVGVLFAGMYGGYFGAAQGVFLMGLLSLLSSEPLQRLNGYKNVLVLIVNFVAAAVFVIFARDDINWAAAGLIAVGALIGGVVGARIGRRLSPAVLRGVIVVIGVVAIVKLVWFP